MNLSGDETLPANRAVVVPLEFPGRLPFHHSDGSLRVLAIEALDETLGPNDHRVWPQEVRFAGVVARATRKRKSPARIAPSDNSPKRTEFLEPVGGARHQNRVAE